MSFEYQRVPDRFYILQYIGPNISVLYLLCLISTLNRLRSWREVRRTILIVQCLCCLIFISRGLWWIDFYIGFPLWLLTILEYWNVCLELAVIERLACSWLTIYLRYMSTVQGLTTYSKVLQRSVIAVNLVFQVGFIIIMTLNYFELLSNIRLISFIYTEVGELFAVFYIFTSAFKLTNIIKLYFEEKYNRNIKLIASLATFIFLFRVLALGFNLLFSLGYEEVYWISSLALTPVSLVFFFIVLKIRHSVVYLRYEMRSEKSLPLSSLVYRKESWANSVQESYNIIDSSN